MKPQRKYFMSINSSSPREYQFIHIDIEDKYGIACKVIYHSNSETFEITHLKKIEMQYPFKEKKVEILGICDVNSRPCQKMTSNMYCLLPTNNVGTNDDDFLIKRYSKHHKIEVKRKGFERPSKNNIVDLKIEGDEHKIDFSEITSLKDLNCTQINGRKIRYGNQFCRFYMNE